MNKFDHEWYGPSSRVSLKKIIGIAGTIIILIALIAGFLTAEWRRQVMWEKFNQERTAFATFQNLSFYDVGGEVVVKVYSQWNPEDELIVGDE